MFLELQKFEVSNSIIVQNIGALKTLKKVLGSLLGMMLIVLPFSYKALCILLYIEIFMFLLSLTDATLTFKKNIVCVKETFLQRGKNIFAGIRM